MNTVPIDHATLSAALAEASIPADASDVHGSVCGLLCGGGGGGDWMRSLALADGVTNGSGRGLLDALLDWSRQQLDDPDLVFQPLLPRDDQPLRARAEALASWCRGFLGGFGLAPRPSGVGDEAEEVLADLAGIAASCFETDEVGEEEEGAYVELIEYVRMAAMFLRSEQASPDAGARRH
jgi:uncharacterized protein YgfB (UPF0149 family)